MYPYPIYLVGCPDEVGQALAGPVGNVGGTVAGRFVSADDAVGQLWKVGVAVVLVAVTDESGLGIVRALRSAAPGCPVLALTDSPHFVRALQAGADQAVLLPLDPGDCEAAFGVIAERLGPPPVALPSDAIVTPPLPAAPSPRTSGSVGFPAPRTSGSVGFPPARSESPSRTIAAPTSRAVPAPPRPTTPGRLVVVTGACGGVGATTVAVNLAVELADLGASVILAEPTQPVGRLALFFDAHPAYTTNDLYADGRWIDPGQAVRALHPVGERLRLLAAQHRPVRTAPPPPDAAEQVVAAVRGEADFVLVDMPCTYDDRFFTFLSGADTAVLVGDQRIPSVRTLQMLTEVLGQAGKRGRVVLNRYNPGLTGFATASLQTMLQTSAVTTVADDPKAAGEALNKGRPLRTVAPRSPARTDLARLARSLVADPAGGGSDFAGDGRDVAAPPLLGRLARAFGLAGGRR